MAMSLQAEIDRNFDQFQRQLSHILPERQGEFALMRGGDIVRFYDSPFEAERAAERQFKDGLYSIQEVTDAPADLGFFTYAFDNREA